MFIDFEVFYFVSFIKKNATNTYAHFFYENNIGNLSNFFSLCGKKIIENNIFEFFYPFSLFYEVALRITNLIIVF